MSEKSVAHLHGPVVVWLKRESRRTRVPWMGLEVVTILVRLSAVEDRAFHLEPAIGEARRENAKTDVSGILKVMRQRRRWILRGRSAMHECSWPKRRLARIAKISEPGSAFAQRDRVLRRQLHPKIVRVLAID